MSRAVASPNGANVPAPNKPDKAAPAFTAQDVVDTALELARRSVFTAADMEQLRACITFAGDDPVRAGRTLQLLEDHVARLAELRYMDRYVRDKHLTAGTARRERPT